MSGGGRAADYRAPTWLPGAHAQTVWPALLSPRQGVCYRREVWDSPDGDRIDLDWADPLPHAPRLQPRPTLVLFHGLEGSAQSHYARALMAAAAARGLEGVVVHFRGCGGTLNLKPRAYHSGDIVEADWVLRRLASRPAAGPLLAVGVSLGGNVLLKWLGEHGRAAECVQAAVAVSPPQDLHAGAMALSRGFNRVYTRHFLRTLKPKSLALLDRHPGLLDRSRILASRDFFDFDEHVTARLHGFASALDYWTRSSCRPVLGGIAVPTRIINALNDPFLPASVLAGPREVSAVVELVYPAQGGHVGFASGPAPGNQSWLVDRVFGHFRRVLGSLPTEG